MYAVRLEKMFAIEIFKKDEPLGKFATVQKNEQISSDKDSMEQSKEKEELDWKILIDVTMSREFLLFFKNKAFILNAFFLSEINLATDDSRKAGG